MSSGSIIDVLKARRVMTYGVTGSGKSTLAQAIAHRRGLPYVSIDDVCWDAGWTQPDSEELDRRVIPLLRQDEFVIDSVYGRHVDVALDYPRILSLRRLLRCIGRDSIIRWHFASFAKKRERIETWEKDPTSPAVIRLRHPRDAEALLAGL